MICVIDQLASTTFECKTRSWRARGWHMHSQSVDCPQKRARGDTALLVPRPSTQWARRTPHSCISCLSCKKGCPCNRYSSEGFLRTWVCKTIPTCDSNEAYCWYECPPSNVLQTHTYRWTQDIVALNGYWPGANVQIHSLGSTPFNCIPCHATHKLPTRKLNHSLSTICIGALQHQ